MLLRPSVVNPALVMTGHFTGRPVHFEVANAPPRAPSGVVQVINARVHGLPADFGAGYWTPLARRAPREVFQLTETATSLPTAKQTDQFFADFDRPSPPSGSPGNGTTVTIPWSTKHIHGLGVAAFVITNQPRSDLYTRQVDFVMLVGGTVMTLSLVGGSRITPASEVGLARRGLKELERTCGA